MTWLEETINALESIGGTGHVQDIYKYVRENSKRTLKTNWKASIRKSLELHSSDSKAYEGKKDIFKSVEGINKGYWTLREFTKFTPYSADRDELDDKSPDKILTSIYRFQRDTRMIRELKSLYNDCCQICGLTIKVQKQNYSEGHHLRPLGKHHKGPDKKNNILILCPNHHVEFDYGMMALRNDLTIIYSDESRNVQGQKLNSKHQLLTAHIDYHLDNLFNQ